LAKAGRDGRRTGRAGRRGAPASDGSRAREALHFIEIALAAAPQHRGAREAELDALEQLIDLTEGKTYDELGWLETKVREAKEVLGRGVS